VHVHPLHPLFLSLRHDTTRHDTTSSTQHSQPHSPLTTRPHHQRRLYKQRLPEWIDSSSRRICMHPPVHEADRHRARCWSGQAVRRHEPVRSWAPFRPIRRAALSGTRFCAVLHSIRGSAADKSAVPARPRRSLATNNGIGRGDRTRLAPTVDSSPTGSSLNAFASFVRAIRDVAPKNASNGATHAAVRPVWSCPSRNLLSWATDTCHG
jgi:hypothetical protein